MRRPILASGTLLLLGLILCIGTLGCGLLDLLLGNQSAADFETGVGVRVRIENQSGLLSRVQGSYFAADEDARLTSRLLQPAGPESASFVVWTKADRIVFTAILDEDAVVPEELRVTPGDMLAEQEFVVGRDFFGDETLVFIIPPIPIPPGAGPDCNENEILDVLDIQNGVSEDCNNNTIPDECEIDVNSAASGGPFFCESDCAQDCNENGIPDSCDICPPDFGSGNDDFTPSQSTRSVTAGAVIRGLNAGEITLSPARAANILNTKHIITAQVTDVEGFPLEEVLVHFQVLDGGPNAGETGSSLTDAAGTVTFTYTGDGGPGTDLIQAWFLVFEEITVFSNVVEKTWNICSLDCNGNGVPDECEQDTDEDGVIDDCDLCPNDPGKIEPGACGCGISDADSDGDETPDCLDECPEDRNKIEPGACGCGVADDDTDGDQTPDCLDGCPEDPAKIEPGECGCGVSDDDSDGDETPDCFDDCPEDPAKIEPGECGCGVPDDDTDGDETPDCFDQCPEDPEKIEPGVCGCGESDDDTDNDATPDCLDGCPEDPNKIAPGICGCGIPEDLGDDDKDGVENCLDICPIGDDNADCNENGVPDACDPGVRIYWTEVDEGLEGSGPNTGLVRSALADGACDLRTHRFAESFPAEIDIDLTSGQQRLHWVTNSSIESSNLSGFQGATTTGLNNSFFGGLAVDQATRFLYWTEFEFDDKCDFVCLYRLDLSDSQAAAEPLLSNCGGFPSGVAVDSTRNVVFWSEGNRLNKADPNAASPAASVIRMVPQGSFVFGVAIDPSAQRVYWVESVGTSNSAIYRADFSGNIDGPGPLISLNGIFAEHIALDLDSIPKKLYWTVPFEGRIMSAELNGTITPEDFLTGLLNVAGIAVKPGDFPLP